MSRSVLVLLIVSVLLGCRQSVHVANTPQGNACARECMMVYEACRAGRGGLPALECAGDENQCRSTCP